MKTPCRIIFAIAISSIVYGCNQDVKSFIDKKTLDIASIDSITIKRHQDLNHTVVHQPKKLNAFQIKLLANKWNTAIGKGPCIYIPTFEMIAYLSNGKTRSFRINSSSIKETSDWCYDLGDDKFIEKLLRQE